MSDGFRVAVDVGNSSIKIAAALGQDAADDSGLAVSRVSWLLGDWQDQLALCTQAFPPTDPSVQWLLASVNSVACGRLIGWIAQHRPADRFHRLERRHIGIAAKVRFPERVGIDRLLAAKSAFELSARRSAIVIDAGTTITVDLVDNDGAFRGGAILPGLGLQFRSLHEATDKLPQLEIPADLSRLESPGRDTQAAMELGVVKGIVGAVEGLIESFRAGSDAARVYLTGGDAVRLSPAIRSAHRVVIDLPLQGLYHLDFSPPHIP